jgi:hypothetical protein
VDFAGLGVEQVNAQRCGGFDRHANDLIVNTARDHRSSKVMARDATLGGDGLKFSDRRPGPAAELGVRVPVPRSFACKPQTGDDLGVKVTT